MTKESLLDPAQFPVFINDVPNFVECPEVSTFANAVAIRFKSKDHEDRKLTLQFDLQPWFGGFTIQIDCPQIVQRQSLCIARQRLLRQMLDDKLVMNGCEIESAVRNNWW